MKDNKYWRRSFLVNSNKILKKIKLNLVTVLKDRSFIISMIISLFFLGLSFFVNFYAGIYATERASSAVTDIILSNIRTFDVAGLFIYGTLIFWSIFMIICLYYPRKIPYTLKTISLFVVTRAIFISLTHIGPFPTQIAITPITIVNRFSFGGDLFFSGHTGLPFLLALIFWENKVLRIFFILCSIFFAIIVLLGHLHYSIDVLSAFFITYTIYMISKHLFQKDRKFFKLS
jgi:hypothetical protein